MSKRRHNFGTKRFKEKSLFVFHARIALKSLILLFVRLIARGARIRKTHTHTDRHKDKYCNPRACAPRVNYIKTYLKVGQVVFKSLLVNLEHIYKLFKFDINYEIYLHLPPHLRVSLTRLRVSAHQLRIEIGRYHRPKPLPVEERLCQMCNLSAVEDELHFVFQCPRYNDIRTELLKACRNHHHSHQYLLYTH